MQNKQFSQLQTIISSQEELQPSPVVKQRIMAKIHQPAHRWLEPAFRWATSTAVAVLVMFVLWIVVQPGTVLAWQSFQDVTTFRVYRAPAGSANYKLLREIEAQEEVTRYTFLDPLLIPGQDYQYKVEGLQTEGQLAFQETISGNTARVLPAQLAIILTSLMLTFATLYFTNQSLVNHVQSIFAFSTFSISK